jgi:hypothetical protein
VARQAPLERPETDSHVAGDRLYRHADDGGVEKAGHRCEDVAAIKATPAAQRDERGLLPDLMRRYYLRQQVPPVTSTLIAPSRGAPHMAQSAGSTKTSYTTRKVRGQSGKFGAPVVSDRFSRRRPGPAHYVMEAGRRVERRRSSSTE